MTEDPEEDDHSHKDGALEPEIDPPTWISDDEEGGAVDDCNKEEEEEEEEEEENDYGEGEGNDLTKGPKKRKGISAVTFEFPG